MAELGKDLTEPAMIGRINADLAYQGLVDAGPNFDREKVIAATNKLTVVGDPAKPWNCWPGDTREWSEPVPMDFR